MIRMTILTSVLCFLFAAPPKLVARFDANNNTASNMVFGYSSVDALQAKPLVFAAGFRGYADAAAGFRALPLQSNAGDTALERAAASVARVSDEDRRIYIAIGGFICFIGIYSWWWHKRRRQ